MNIDGLVKFTESISFDNNFIIEAKGKELFEYLEKAPVSIKESVSNNSLGWWVPISIASDIRRNGNGRIYGTKLWENVINNQSDVYKQCPMLCDHPAGDSDGSPKDICGVWLDAKLGKPNDRGERVVYGLLVPSGKLGEDLQSHLKNGLKVGTSTSGFGKLMMDGETVDPDTYKIERLADWVLCPSASVYFSYDENGDIEDRSIFESKENNNQKSIKESNTFKEKVVEDSKITKLEEKKLRRTMESFLKEADNIKDPQERLEEFKEIKSYLDEGVCPDLREAIEKKIAEQEEEIKNLIHESLTMKEELDIADTKDLQEKLTRISEDYSLVEKESKDWKKIATDLQDKILKIKEELEKRPSEKYVNFLKTKNAELSESLSNLKVKSDEMIASLTEAVNTSSEKIESLNEEVKTLNESKSDLEVKLTESNNTNAKIFAGKAISDENKANTAKELDEAKKMIESLNKVIASQRSKLEESTVQINDLKNQYIEKKQEYAKLAKETREAQSALKEAREELKPIRSLNAVEEYYESLYKIYGNDIKPYKRMIEKSVNLTEAKHVFFSKVLQNLNESQKIDDMRIPESMAIDPEDRIKAIGAERFIKTGITDRLPEGWV